MSAAWIRLPVCSMNVQPESLKHLLAKVEPAPLTRFHRLGADTCEVSQRFGLILLEDVVQILPSRSRRITGLCTHVGSE